MVQRLKVDGLVDNRRACDCSIYIVFLVLFCRLYYIPVDNLCCTTFVFDSYDDIHGDVHGDGRCFDGHELVC